jgi:hypothetical protein
MAMSSHAVTAEGESSSIRASTSRFVSSRSTPSVIASILVPYIVVIGFTARLSVLPASPVGL